jgi:3-dehydroquinate dehydratase
MKVETLLLIRYFAARRNFLLPLEYHGGSAECPDPDLIVLDPGQRLFRYVKIMLDPDPASFAEVAGSLFKAWNEEWFENLRSAQYIANTWNAQAVFFVPEQLFGSLRDRISTGNPASPHICVGVIRDLWVEHRWPRVDAVLAPARTSSPEPSAKSLLPADLAAEKLRRAWIEGHRTPVTEAPTSVISPDEGSQPGTVLNRLLLKAEASHLAGERERMLLLGSDFATEIAPLVHSAINRAKALPDCYLWMVHPSKAPAAAPEVFEVLAHCFTNTAKAFQLALELSSTLEAPAELKYRSLEVLAEAQSALRAQVEVLEVGEENDQLAVFQWLRRLTQEERIYLPRHMRKEDPANPANWADLRRRIEELYAQFAEQTDLQRRRRKLWGKIRHKCALLSKGAGSDNDPTILMQAVEELTATGVPPSDPQLRDLLLPCLDTLPERTAGSPGFETVLQEIDRFLADQAQLEEQRKNGRQSTRDTEVVDRVAEALRDRAVVLIGGCRRPHSHEALQTAFKLSELIWMETSEHTSVTQFEPYVSRPDVALVLLAVRWSSHSYGEIAQYCERYGKPLVRLPSGYNPNQVASQILRQQGQRLGIDTQSSSDRLAYQLSDTASLNRRPDSTPEEGSECRDP